MTANKAKHKCTLRVLDSQQVTRLLVIKAIAVIMKKVLLIIFLFSAWAYASPTPENICSISKNLVCGSNTTVLYIGNLEDKYQVYSYTHIFNNGNRAANRVLFINYQGVLSGMYAIDVSINKIEDDCVLFKAPKKEGNSICLTDGKLPTKAWVNGYNPELFI